MSNCTEKEWILRQETLSDGRSFREVGEELGLSPVIVRCLCNRGVKTEDEIRKFLYATPADLYDPMRMKGVPEAVELLLSLNPATRIAIASDYDCDGICSGVLLKRGLEQIGFQTMILTPDRVSEGYGLNRRIVDDAVAEGCTVLITCDNGIAAVDAVRYAKEKGLTVIVTDHHEPQEELPPADVIVDPKQEGETYPFSGLCGAGVAYKLISALYARVENGDTNQYDQLVRSDRADLLNGEYLVLTAIATVADVMELVDENRILVSYGLKALSATGSPGLRALLRVLELEEKPIRASDIAFRLGPTLNATGRIASVEEAFSLLLAEEEEEALVLARKLFAVNQERKELTDKGTARGIELVQEQYPEADRGRMEDVLILYLEGVHESLVGLIAGKIKERFNHPVIVFTDGTPGDQGELRLKGSGRSIAPYHMFNRLMECKDLTVAFGGHAMAAGLTIPKENLDELRSRLNRESGLNPEDFVEKLMIDVPVPISYLTEGFINTLDQMAPFGVANPRPIFAEKDLKVLRVLYMGKEKQHVKLVVVGKEGTQVDAVAFFRADEFDDYISETYGAEELKKMQRGGSEVRLSLAYQPQINEWNGVRSIQLSIVDWR